MLHGEQFEANQKKLVEGICDGKVPITAHTTEALARRKTLLSRQLTRERERLAQDVARIDDDLDYAAIGLDIRMIDSAHKISDLAKQMLEVNEAQEFVSNYLDRYPPHAP